MSHDEPTMPMRPGERPALSGARTHGADPPGEGILPRGTAIARYLVLEPLGEGGMGVVYAAYDPELDRRVAIKLLHLREEAGSQGRARLMREAQAMARLQHPNVLAVHDVGHYGEEMFMAMELVDGWTLRQWQRHPGRPWREKLDAYLAAGRGLVAAHAAGLVHRDFKPDNVLVGRDKRVRVTDFGLVRAAHPEDQPLPPVVPLQPRYDGPLGVTPGASPLTGDLTAAGAVLGTPHYMAPEQYRGELADERSDQFSFCVAVWEALLGERPFQGLTLDELAEATKTGRPRPPPARHGLPARLVTALERGLSADPAARWPSMRELLSALEAAAQRKMSRRATLGLALVSIAGVAGLTMAARGRGPLGAGADPCAQAAAPMAEIWDAGARAEISAAFLGTRAPFATDALTGVQRALDDYTGRWSAMAVESCRATRVSGAQTQHAGDLRAACLGRRADELAGVIAGLRRADREMVEQAVAQLAQLPALEDCADVAALEARARPRQGDPAVVARVAELDHRLAELSGSTLIDRSFDAAATAPLVAEAEALGYAPLTARARILEARAALERHDGQAARASLLAATAAAIEGHDDTILAEALLLLASAHVDPLAAYDDGERFLALAAAAVGRLAEPGGKRQRLAHQRGTLLRARGKPAEARPHLEEALELAKARRAADPVLVTLYIDLFLCARDQGERKVAADYLAQAEKLALAAFGPNHPRVATIIHDLAVIAYDDGDWQVARDHALKALAIREAALGPDDRDVGRSLEVLAVAELELGHVTEARAHFERALVIAEKTLGAEHPDVAVVLNGLGGVYHRQGDHQAALAANTRALAIREKALGPEHPDLAFTLVNIAISLKNMGRYAEAEPNYRRAIAILEKGYGPTHFAVGVAYINLGELLRTTGRADPALVAYGKARTVFEAQQLPPEHPVWGHVWNGVGQAELMRGRAAKAVETLEQAVAIREADPGDQDALAESRFALARALLAAGRDRGRARTLAEQAAAAWAKLGEKFAGKREEAEAWLRRLR